MRSPSKIFNERHRKLNQWAKEFAQQVGWSAKEYRKFKSDPIHTGHQFQRIMCAGVWEKLDFAQIPGRALFKLVSHRGRGDDQTVFERHHLIDRYVKWILSRPIAPFTGYVYELYQAAAHPKLSLPQRITYDKQFEGLLRVAKKDRGGE